VRTADTRVVLDAYPQITIPAKVSFIDTQAQFTPKTVETRTGHARPGSCQAGPVPQVIMAGRLETPIGRAVLSLDTVNL
jgi:hypothetical protein